MKIIAWTILILLVVFLVPISSGKRTSTPDVNVSELKFPQGFYFGAATASHQVEGNNNNQLTIWEKENAEKFASEAESKLSDLPSWELIKKEATNPQGYISGITVDQYNRYPADIKLMQEIGLNAYRFSIEWSRIEPEKGKYNSAELEHYRTEIRALRAAGIEPFVTLWHRSEPVWLMQQGEWENSESIQDYKKYVEYVVVNLGGDVKYWMTFNEPVLHVVAGYVEGSIPPAVKSISRANKVMTNMIEANNQAYDAIHILDSDAVVGNTQAMQLGYGSPPTVANQLLAAYLSDYSNWKFLDGTKDKMDFVGIQYYGPTMFALGFGGSNFVKVKNFENSKAEVRSDAGREVYPAGIYELIIQSHKRYGKPIIITENGIADKADSMRADYIADHLYWVKKAMDEGIPVHGYIHWSLLDNFEWNSGRWPRFGLVEVDYENNLTRRIRPSAQVLRQIIENSK